jgi:holliday junction DNA helicase RuvA
MRVNALCYEVLVPSGVASRLRQSGGAEHQNPRTFYTIEYIDGGIGGGHLTPHLIGFLDPLDREFFTKFTSVPGLGYKKALKCLVRPLNEIALAIERGDTQSLKDLPYIGQKIAERIVTDLRGKMAKFALSHTEQPLAVDSAPYSELRGDAVAALQQIEYSQGEAQRIAVEIFSRHKNIKTVEEFLRKVFEQQQGSKG